MNETFETGAGKYRPHKWSEISDKWASKKQRPGLLEIEKELLHLLLFMLTFVDNKWANESFDFQFEKNERYSIKFLVLEIVNKWKNKQIKWNV